MGGGQSARATHFQRPGSESSSRAISDEDEEPEERHISISNKMVERLVEDASLAAAVSRQTSTTPRSDIKETINIEKLNLMDEQHSERCGLRIGDVQALASRVEKRTEKMVNPEPVCADCKERVIQCYNMAAASEDYTTCYDSVFQFQACVHEAAAGRLKARTKRDARENALRSRHMAHAREYVLKDLGPQPPGEYTEPLAT